MKYVHKIALKEYSQQYHSEENEENEETEEKEKPYYHDETYHIEYERGEEDDQSGESPDHIVIENDCLEMEDLYDPLVEEHGETNGDHNNDEQNLQESNQEELDLDTSFQLSE